MMTEKRGRLIIFEGPDCGGKTSAINEVAKQMSDIKHRVHHGPYPRITAEQLPRIYIESMIPLLMDQGSDMVMDRSWLSEPVYADAFREGNTRVTVAERRQLERIALRHGAVVVLCLPPWEAVKTKWLERKGADAAAEYLDQVDQLRYVYDQYDALETWTSLPVVRYDYTAHKHRINELVQRINKASTGSHHFNAHRSAGSAQPKVILVGEAPSDQTDRDTSYQFPFCSFSRSGSSLWLTDHLAAEGISERDLFWVNASDFLYFIKDMWQVPIVALGQTAAKTVKEQVGREPDAVVNHPQHHKRFKARDGYELAQTIISLKR